LSNGIPLYNFTPIVAAAKPIELNVLTALTHLKEWISVSCEREFKGSKEDNEVL
jgi:hypothetical protein